MKKTYKAPILNIVQIKTAHIIAASIEMFGKDATEAAMSRDQGNSFWEDEDE